MPENNGKKKKRNGLDPLPNRLGLGERTTMMAPPTRLSQIVQNNGPIGLGSLTEQAMDKRTQEDTSSELRKKRKPIGLNNTEGMESYVR